MHAAPGCAAEGLLRVGQAIKCPVVAACGVDLSPQTLFRGPEMSAEPLSQHLPNATFEKCALVLDACTVTAL